VFGGEFGRIERSGLLILRLAFGGARSLKVAVDEAGFPLDPFAPSNRRFDRKDFSASSRAT